MPRLPRWTVALDFPCESGGCCPTAPAEEVLIRRARRVVRPLLLVVCAGLGGMCATPAHASFPGSNGRIAYRGFDDSDDEIYSVNPDGAGLRKLTSDDTGERYPAWSPDGKQIAFSRGFDIWVMDADGSNETQVTFADMYDKPAWSPDGSRIAAALAGGFGLAVMDADGSNVTLLTQLAPYADGPTWSPDGTRIAYAANSDIYLVNPDGSGETPLITRRAYDIAPNWSPDGSMIAFSRFGRRSEFGDIHVMRLDGSYHRRLTRVAAYDVNPVWSPDGSMIAWERCGSIQGIFVMQADGSGKTKVTDAHYTCTGSYPDWQPLP